MMDGEFSFMLVPEGLLTSVGRSKMTPTVFVSHLILNIISLISDHGWLPSFFPKKKSTSIHFPFLTPTKLFYYFKGSFCRVDNQI